MARTKASVGAKISSGKSSKARCCVVTPASSSGSGSNSSLSRPSTSAGNPVCHRETPKWQRPITNFFIEKEPQRADDQEAGSSSEPLQARQRKSKRNIIDSDEENDDNGEKKSENADKSQNAVKSDNEGSLTEELNGNDSESFNNDPKNGKTVDQDEVLVVHNKVLEGTVVHNEESAKIAKNQELEESIHLEQLDGDQSHKIEEYYSKSNKGKGLGKKSKKNKENLDSNRRESVKRDLEEISDDASEDIPNNKKVKLK